MKKIRERYLLERFLETIEVDAQIVEERESPDFEIAINGRTIGVELTEVFALSTENNLSLQAGESITSKIVAAAKRIYVYQGNRPAHVMVVFFGGIDLRSLRRDRVAEALAKLVQAMPLHDQKHVSWHNDYEDTALNPIASVRVLPVPEESMAHWGVGRAGWPAPLTVNTLQTSVTKKNERVKIYRKRYEEIWLVLAIEGRKPSQFFDLDHLPDCASIDTEFDQTYFFSALPRSLRKLGKQ